MSEYIKFEREDGVIEYRHEDYDYLISQPIETSDEYIEIPEEELLEWMRTTYQRQRALEYPPITDQLDALWKGGKAAEDMMTKIQEIKNKYPKPEGSQ